jgi:hypothetical protein
VRMLRRVVAPQGAGGYQHSGNSKKGRSGVRTRGGRGDGLLASIAPNFNVLDRWVYARTDRETWEHICERQHLVDGRRFVQCSAVGHFNDSRAGCRRSGFRAGGRVASHAGFT